MVSWSKAAANVFLLSLTFAPPTGGVSVTLRRGPFTPNNRTAEGRGINHGTLSLGHVGKHVSRGSEIADTHGSQQGAGAGAGQEAHVFGHSDAIITTSRGSVSAQFAADLERFTDYDNVHETKDMHLGHLIDKHVESMQLQDAVDIVNQSSKLPPEVYSILNSLVRHEAHQQPDDLQHVSSEDKIPNYGKDQIAKGVHRLNKMIKQAHERLDSKAMECNEFKQKNRRTFQQVTSDLSRLSQSIADLARQKTKTMSRMDEINTHYTTTHEELEKQRQAYIDRKRIADKELRQRKRDLFVSTFLLMKTACRNVPDFVQRSGADAAGSEQFTTFDVHVCTNGTGNLELSWKDPQLEAALKNFSSESEMLLHQELARAQLASGGELDQNSSLAEILRVSGLAASRVLGDREDGDERDLPVVDRYIPPREYYSQNLPHLLQVGPPTADGSGPPKCANAQPNCGVIHDIFSMLWGDQQDLVESSMEAMYKDQENWENFQKASNVMMQGLAVQKGSLQGTLAEATSNQASESEDQNRKQEQADQLTSVFEHTWAECQATMRDILFTDICGITKVRNAILEAAKRDRPIDCQVGQWVPDECSVTCDDTLEGGNQEIHRSIIVVNTPDGSDCPPLETAKKCNAVRCPVDCELSPWSEFSKCTTDCGGGVMSRTRSVAQKAANGGMVCDALQESQPCNTGSCDRDCTLSDWTPWSVCSNICGGGEAGRVRMVTLPIRGLGSCPTSVSSDRLQTHLCNEQACFGDEVCVGAMDVAIAIDSSGSVTDKGFDVLKTYVLQLIERFRGSMYGHEAMKVAIIQYGNGKLIKNVQAEKHGVPLVVTDAKLVVPLTSPGKDVVEKIKALKWQKGFTNMAQAVLKTKDALSMSLRDSSQRIAIFVTDGRPTFRSNTRDAMKALKAQGVEVVVMHVKSNPTPQDVELLKSYASRPAAWNYMHVPGKKVLQADYHKFVTELLVQVCNKAESPEENRKEELLKGYRMKLEGQNCGKGYVAVSEQFTTQDCFHFADITMQEKGDGKDWSAFAYSDETQKCLIYAEPCDNFFRNATYNLYDRSPIATTTPPLEMGMIDRKSVV